jgi:dual specificity tyrosine-phosphorylation-regulated kinase 2/3/4
MQSASNPLLPSFFPRPESSESKTVFNFNLRPRLGSQFSQPMPSYQLQKLFPPSDRFPSQSVNISPRSSLNSTPVCSPVRRLGEGEEGFPMTAVKAVQLFKAKLTKWELDEINSYKIIYTVGQEAEKIVPNSNFRGNFGFDDEKGKYKIVIKDHIAYRYEICEVYGNGTFGVVVKALDLKENVYVALKIIDKKSNVGNETEILQYLKEKNKNLLYGVVDYQGNFVFREHQVIVFEVLSINLYEFLRQSNFEGLVMSLIRRIASQILQTLNFLHRNNVVHCDLKPENILFKELNRSVVKLVDFGTSCFEGRNIFTYIQSRYYRAPEIILGLGYNSAIDIWSFGCILAELQRGLPVFAGENELDQLFAIMEFCGSPPLEMILASKKRKSYFEDNCSVKNVKTCRNGSRKPASKTFSQFLKDADEGFVDLVTKCLEIDPAKRINAQEALSHPWLMDFSMKTVNLKKEPVKRKFSLNLKGRAH